MHPISSGGTAPRTQPAQARLDREDIRPLPPGIASYPRFHAAVAHAQLTSWLPGGRGVLLDMSGPGAHPAEVAACAGHSVLRVIGPEMTVPDGAGDGPGTGDWTGAGDQAGTGGLARGRGRYRQRPGGRSDRGRHRPRLPA